MGHTLPGALGFFSLNILLYCGHAQDKPQPVLTVSPLWLSPGASVTLNCSVEHPSAGWRFFWYKAVPRPSNNSFYSFQHLSGSIHGTEQDSYIVHGQTHTTGYVCRAGRGDPVYYTHYSRPKFVWSGDFHPAASLTVSPDRVQHFTSDSLSLSCEGNSTEWRVRRFSKFGYLTHCFSWGTVNGNTCNIRSSQNIDGVYWCESHTGQFSNAVNITGSTASRPEQSSPFPVLLIVGLVGGVSLILLLLLFVCRYTKSKDSCFMRSQSTNQSPAPDHMINQAETQCRDYASLLHGDVCLYETIRDSEKPEHGRNNEPEENEYSNVTTGSAAD
ncbi:uncharacterized protein LOC125884296 [Epinephelus fuscoguttatus]|uniref:uncharacterized protein LOC125884296 n=1 Tax=Epinephelus fuscoguttatus TaxID=293821 RepID=UPI0020D0C2CC|nr:uncharacterized protein LOC125884296 [Epinephelus fuscoguttatus]